MYIYIDNLLSNPSFLGKRVTVHLMINAIQRNVWKVDVNSILISVYLSFPPFFNPNSSTKLGARQFFQTIL